MRPARALLLVVALAAALVSVPSAAQADHCQRQEIDCVHSDGDQSGGAIVTTGVVWPGQGPDTPIGQVSGRPCDGCEWKLVIACMANGPENPNDALCGVAVQSCALRGQDGILYRVYYRDNADPGWRMLQTVCIGPGDQPVPIADVAQAVREQVVSRLPDAAPSFQPAAGGIVNLPTIFDAGEPGSFETPSFEVLGLPVVVTATATWDWTFDEGVTRAFTVPGGRYPDDSVSYTYPSPGARAVTVTTSWQGSFTVAGNGPYAVPGPPLTKTAGPLAVPVREARSHLVGG